MTYYTITEVHTLMFSCVGPLRAEIGPDGKPYITVDRRDDIKEFLELADDDEEEHPLRADFEEVNDKLGDIQGDVHQLATKLEDNDALKAAIESLESTLESIERKLGEIEREL